MKEKHLYYLGGVFLALIIIYFISKPRMATINYDEIVQTVIFGVSKEDVAGIEVYKQTADKEIRMQLMKQDDQWFIPTKFNAKVKEYDVNRILDDMLEMTGKVTSSDPKHLETFKISDTQGIHVLLKDEAQKPLANLIVGKKGEDYNEGFVRFADKEKIYRVDKNLLSSLGVYGDADTLTKFNDKSFIDLTAVKIEKNDLKMAALVANGKEMIIKKVEKEQQPPEGDDAEADTTKPVKKEYEWVLLKGKKEVKLDQKEVDKFFRDVSNVNAQEVVDYIGGTLGDLGKANKYRVDRPKNYMVFIKEENDEKLNVLFGKEYEKDKGYFMNVQHDNLVYKVAKSKFDAIFKWVNDLPTKLPQPKEEKKS